MKSTLGYSVRHKSSISNIILTLKCLRYFSLPFVHKVGVHLDPFISLVLSGRNFGTKLAPYHSIHPKQPYKSEKKNDQKNISLQNGESYLKKERIT